MLPSLCVVLDVPVKVAELLHAGEDLDCTPANIADELHWTHRVGSAGETKQKIQFSRIDFLLHQKDLERHLGREYQLVALKEPTCGVLEHLEGYAVDQILNPELNILVHHRSLDCHVKDNAEGFQTELIHQVDLVEVVQDEI